MKNAFASRISYFILTFIFLIIAASFLFSNFDGFSTASTKHVATVDGTPITTKEYQMALSRQVEFFNQMMGGSGMTQKQLEEMGIKQSVMNGLVQQKLILNTADDMGFIVSMDEVKNEIKSLPYFKTKEQFDVNLYRNMLLSNGFIPTQFEDLVSNDLKQKKVDEMFNSMIVSDNYVKDVLKFKNSVLAVQGVKISRQSLAPLVTVSEQEIKQYLEKPENKKALEESYTENITKYNKPEEVKARHILIQGQDEKALEKIKALAQKVTLKNFAELAQKETEDPTGKANGGDLGWFSAGRMVPEFEEVAFKQAKNTISQPVKTQFGYHLILVEDKRSSDKKSLDSVKTELAQLAIQKTKSQDLDKLLKSTEQELSGYLTSGDIAAAEALAKKVDGQFFKTTDINMFDQTLAQAALAPKEAEELFKAEPGQVVNLGNPGTIYLVKIVSKGQSPDLEKKLTDQLKGEVTTQSQMNTKKIREELVKALNNKAKVVTNQNLL
ncbi:MAG TPA: SurA N-terminal domain-containing protein [Bacteriovoracaceae bacterium]|nr:SurA N-terminal domain-containing protein [Bacteriovoracaceae bacterium]